MSEPVRIAVAGASGRMGRMLLETVTADPDAQLVAALDAPSSAAIGVAARAFGATQGEVVVSADAAALPAGAVLIDFTRPEATLAYLDSCARRGVAMVIGTTGFDAAGKAAIEAAAQHIPVVYAANFSVGVNTVLRLLALAAQSLDAGYDVEILEMHHRMKVDAPSGTALRMGEVIAGAQGTELAERAVYAREGHTGERQRGTIGFATLRGGDVVGDHTVIFAGLGERIEITHKSSSRLSYAQGAVRAARFAAGRAPGLYGMDDVLGFKAV